MSDDYMLRMNFDPPAAGLVPTTFVGRIVPASEMPPVDLPPPDEVPPPETVEEKEKKARDSISARIGNDLYDWLEAFRKERDLLCREVVTAALLRYRAIQEAQGQANTAGGLAFSGSRVHVIMVGKTAYFAETAELAAEIVGHLNRMTDGRWKAVEKIKEWRTNSLRDAKILPKGPREAVEARIERDFQGFMADIDRDMPVNATTQAITFEATEITAVVARELERE
jgi:L-lactate utilization protein LutB